MIAPIEDRHTTNLTGLECHMDAIGSEPLHITDELREKWSQNWQLPHAAGQIPQPRMLPTPHSL